MTFGQNIIQVVRTIPLGAGMRSVWYLPSGDTVHAIEDLPIPLGTYFLTPDETGRHRNWVIEIEPGTRIAVPARGVRARPRKHVEVHVGNYMTDTIGCTCPGLFANLGGVGESRKAVLLMRDLLGRDGTKPLSWVLQISGNPTP